MNENDEVMRVELFLTDARAVLDEEQNERRQLAPRFNVTDALGVTRTESAHSEFVAHLLHPMERHNQGDIFLTAFLKFLQRHFEWVNFQPASTRSASVQREANLTPYGRCDICIWLANGQIFMIENKVDALEDCGQIGGYQKWLQLQWAPDGFPHQLVFLTPNGRPPVSTPTPEDVVCLSYSQLADWIARSRQQVESDRLGVVMAQYEDTCRLIGGTVRGDAMPGAIRQFFLEADEPGRLETALAIEGYLEDLKMDIFRRFLERVTANLSMLLTNGNHNQCWNAELDNNLFQRWSGFRIAWRTRQNQPHFAVRVESSFGHTQDSALFYGINRGYAVQSVHLVNQDRQLRDTLAKQQFTHYDQWWSGYRYFRALGPHQYDITNNNDVLALHHEMLYPNGPLTRQVTTQVWELFDAHRLTLENLNRNYPYL